MPPVATFVQEGALIDYTPSGADVAAGDVVVVGELVGVAPNDILDGQKGAIAIEGVYKFPKPTGAGTGSPAGTQQYWDAADQNAQETADSGTNKKMGVNLVATGDNDTTVLIKLGRHA